MFWILTQMTKMDIKEGFRLITVGSTICGLSAAIIIWAVGLVVL